MGEAQPQAHQKGGTHPARFKRTREALRSRSKVKPQWAQWNTRFSKVRSRLIPPHRKHSREVLKAGTGKTSFPLFRNPHSSSALSSEKEESYSPILLFPVPPLWIKPWRFKSSSTSTSYSRARRAPSLKNTSRLKFLTRSCSIASFVLALNQFFERNLFLGSTL